MSLCNAQKIITQIVLQEHSCTETISAGELCQVVQSNNTINFVYELCMSNK